MQYSVVFLTDEYSLLDVRSSQDTGMLYLKIVMFYQTIVHFNKWVEVETDEQFTLVYDGIAELFFLLVPDFTGRGT